MLAEAKRLFALGWGVHWLKAKSKVPVKKGWTTGPRDDWKTVEREYKKEYGLGVRLGSASKLPSGGYLANIDVDIKSSDPRHRAEALQALERLFPGLHAAAPIVRTGYGLRLFIKTTEPLPPQKHLAISKEECVVRMPTAEINARQKRAVVEGLVSEAQLEAGWRVRPAWEIDFMSQGQQVVLPPSTHPETGKPYVWERKLGGDLPTVNLKTDAKDAGPTHNNTISAADISQNFTPVNVDLIGSPLSDKIVDMLLQGKGVEDRSAAVFSVTLAMSNAGFSDAEIMTVLTDRGNYLGDVSFEHAKTKKRSKAAKWVAKYNIEKARRLAPAPLAPEVAFDSPIPDALPELPAAVQAAQMDVLTTQPWESRIKRAKAKDGEEGKPLPTVQNTVLVLTHGIAPNLFTYDKFALREAYGVDAPWTGGEKGQAVTDRCVAHIVYWLGCHYRFEPADGVVYKAITTIAGANNFHPVKDELEALPKWDGVERLDTWLRDHFQAEGPDEYLAQVFRKWLVASVTRTYIPGYKFDWMPILEGMQGTGKSSFGEMLFGRDYFSDWLPDLAQKDAAAGLQGRRVHEFGELDSMRKNEVDTTKAFITRTIDRFRPSYGRHVLESRRSAVFFGTTNNRGSYLKDDTGNRRFMPVVVGRLDFKALRRDRNQLWAEALFIYRNGLEATLYLEDAAAEHATVSQMAKLAEDEKALIVDALEAFMGDELAKKERGEPMTIDFGKFSINDLFNFDGPLARWNGARGGTVLAARVIRSLGGQKWKSHGHAYWKMVPYVKTDEKPGT